MAIFQVVHKQRWLLQEIRNVYYYETITGNPATSEWDDIVDEIRADYVAELSTDLSTNWEFYGIDFRQVDVSGLPSFSAIPTLGIFAGTDVADDVPTQVAMLISVKENTTAPNHVRTYLAGLTEDGNNLSLWKSGVMGSAETFIDLQSVLNAAGANELQRVSARWNTAHDAVTAFNNVAGAAAVASQVPATQRRRRIGIGI